MIAAWLLLAGAALAAHHIVRAGETVADIAATLGDPALEAEIRALNRLSRDQRPEAGTVLLLPELATIRSDQPAHVATLRGSGTVQAADGSRQPLAVGMPLEIGATVCTDPDSFSRIRLTRGLDSYIHDDVSLLPSTCVTVSSTIAREAHHSSLVELRQGSVNVHRADEDRGEVVVRSSAGLTTGEAGGFRVTLEETAARTEAVEGPVAVIGAGVEVALAAGEGNRVSAGEAPTPPVPLLRPGHPTHPEDRAVLFRPSFGWAADPLALGYRIEVAADPGFTDLLLGANMIDTAWEPAALLLPYRIDALWWRVSAFDRAGYQGIPSSGRELVLPPGVGP